MIWKYREAQKSVNVKGIWKFWYQYRILPVKLQNNITASWVVLWPWRILFPTISVNSVINIFTTHFSVVHFTDQLLTLGSPYSYIEATQQIRFHFVSYLFIYSSFVGPWPLFHFLNPRLLGRGISPSQGRYLHTEQHRHRENAYRHPCLEWDSNPRSQRSSERRQFMPQTARPLWSAISHPIQIQMETEQISTK
jgi:hypothetical protein